MKEIAKDTISATLRELGVAPGDWLFVHASYKSFGRPVEGGPEGLIDALLQAIAPGGTLLAPTHGPAPSDCFHPDRGEMYPGMGVIPRLISKRPHALRSYHPTHSDTALGPDAAQLLQGHEHAGAVGPDSPLGKLRRDPRGKILMLGTSLSTLTLIHLCEQEARLPYIGKAYGGQFPPSARVERDGQTIEVSIQDIPGHSSAFHQAEPLLLQEGLIQKAQLHDCRMMLIPAGPAANALTAALRKKPDLVLGKAEDDFFFANARRILAEHKML